VDAVAVRGAVVDTDAVRGVVAVAVAVRGAVAVCGRLEDEGSTTTLDRSPILFAHHQSI
jgi:hypothetical protein